jgi:hypothetical protein
MWGGSASAASRNGARTSTASPAVHIKLYAADVVWRGEKHAIYAVIDAATDDLYADLAKTAAPMIEGPRLPAGVEDVG